MSVTVRPLFRILTPPISNASSVRTSSLRTIPKQAFLKPARAYSDHPVRHLNSVNAPTREELYIETFGRLAPWSQCLENDHLVDVRIRHYENHPIKVQSALISRIANQNRATVSIIWPKATSPNKPILDLTSFETTASMVFLFWLYNRRLPKLKADCDLQQPIGKKSDTEKKIAVSDRDKSELYNVGLIEAWRLGAALASTKFMNDILLHLAALLDLEEAMAERSRDPEYSAAIAWARRAYDCTKEGGRKEMRDFAVDVAAKRVYDVGSRGMTLSLEERKALSGSHAFSAEVFGSLGGQIGTGGVSVGDFVREYLVKEHADIPG